MRKLRSPSLLVVMIAIVVIAVAAVAYAASGGAQSGPDTFKLSGGGLTVPDTSTNLVWQRTQSVTLAHPNAIAYCSNLVLAGKSDWRLPSMYEIFRLMDYSQGTLWSSSGVMFVSPLFEWQYPASTGVFTAMWSSTPVTGWPTQSWQIELNTSKVYNQENDQGGAVLCVRRLAARLSCVRSLRGRSRDP